MYCNSILFYLNAYFSLEKKKKSTRTQTSNYLKFLLRKLPINKNYIGILKLRQ